MLTPLRNPRIVPLVTVTLRRPVAAMPLTSAERVCPCVKPLRSTVTVLVPTVIALPEVMPVVRFCVRQWTPCVVITVGTDLIGVHGPAPAAPAVAIKTRRARNETRRFIVALSVVVAGVGAAALEGRGHVRRQVAA